jgi:rSAM/selenodomain-associated transferase 1
MTLTNRTLVIMAKAPRVGSVKTRLSANLTPQQATELYTCLLNDTIALGQALHPVETVILCPESDAEDLSRSIAPPVPIVPQRGHGLAAGLISVFANFTNSGHRRVIAFNSDSPHLPPFVLENAFNVLENRDLVIGPTDDGGYYLVGAKANHPALFEDDGMSTTSALEALLARARKLQLSAGFTDPFYDIDVASDLTRLAEELQRSPGRAPRTAAWLREWTRTSAHPSTGAGSD